MSTLYLDADAPGFVDDLNARKEYLMLKNAHHHTPEPNVVPYFAIKSEMATGRQLRLRPYQQFDANFMNPDTPWTRLIIMYEMGGGKTLAALGIAMRFIELYRLSSQMLTRRIARENRQPMVFILGYTRTQFERELFRFTEFGFITRQEQEYLGKLRHYANLGAESDIHAYKEFMKKIRRRLKSLRGNGFFRFIGYRELANRLFIGSDGTAASEADIAKGLESKSITINAEYLAQFKDGLLICDEAHNIYNSLEKNNWGAAIQVILNEFGAQIRAVFLSGTILKNSQTEIVDVLNLVAGSKERGFARADFFDTNDNLLTGALERIATTLSGRISFLVDINPAVYPRRVFVGEPIPGAKYIKFERCLMSEMQQRAYDAVADNIHDLYEHSYIFDMVFPAPTEVNVIFKTSDLGLIEVAPPQWKMATGITVDMKQKTISGPILEAGRIKAYSGKYMRMLELLDSIMAGGGGKVFIFHKFVHMTGIFLIKNTLEANGFIGINASPNDGTKCALCGAAKTGHTATHAYAPARFMLVYGEQDKNTIDQNLERYNQKENTFGAQCMILIGSRVMREAHNLMAVQHVFVISRPDNIPGLLQITGRAIRAYSHQHLPPDKQTVSIHVFTAKSSGQTLSYEEARYVQKIRDYGIIQQIERAIHAGAIDARVNRALIEPALVKDDLGHLWYDELAGRAPDVPNTTTFDIFYLEREVESITYIIKRLFIETSKVWRHDDLWAAVRSPGFDTEFDTSLLSECSFMVALDRLLWRNDYFGEGKPPVDLSTSIADAADKTIVLDGAVRGIIVKMEDYYVAFALDQSSHQPVIAADEPFRTAISSGSRLYNIMPYIRTKLSRQRYLDLKIAFKKEYEAKSMSEMMGMICEHGQDFHAMLAEEAIEYAFELWTNPAMIASAEYNSFYFQMLYFYDILGLVIWMNSAQKFIREMYANLEGKFTIGAEHSEILPKVFKEENRGQLISIARTIEKSGCSWCPNVMSTRFDGYVQKSKARFVKVKAAQQPATDDMIPIGHSIDDAPRFFHPDRGWFAAPEYTQAHAAWKENELVIGFDQRSAGGMHIRFRLRNPRQKIKQFQDTRLIERGIICTSRSKPYLLDLASKLAIKSIGPGSNLDTLCREIRARLLYLELLERARGSNIKYFYNQFEDSTMASK